VTPWAPCTLVWAHSAAATLDALITRDPRLAERLHTALGVYALTGRGDIRALVGQSGYRLRVGDWRVVFEVDTIRREVHIEHIAHRRDVYRS
jgi:mRNA interferase RelE/StbE